METKGSSSAEQIKNEKQEKIIDFNKVKIAIIIPCCLWFIKGMWYAYMSGKFLVYHIDNSYINVNSENILLQIMQLIPIFVFGFFSNYILYKILMANDDSKLHWKKIIKVIIFELIEISIMFFLSLFFMHTRLKDFFNQIHLDDFCILLFLYFIFSCLINCYAIESAIESVIKKRKDQNKNPKNKKKIWKIIGKCIKKIKRYKKLNDIKNQEFIENQVHIENQENTENQEQFKGCCLRNLGIIFCYIVITGALSLSSVYITAFQRESDRRNYKLIIIQNEKTAENEFTILNGYDNKTYNIYPIVYENQECYIVTRLYYENGNICMDYNYQKIIEKNGQETFYVDDVYKISGNIE